MAQNTETFIKISYKGLEIPAQLSDVMERNCDNYFTTYYQRNDTSFLNLLCDKYGSDKGEIKSTGHPYLWPSHSYADFVERLFGHCREHVKAVFECGLGTNNPALASNMGLNGQPGASLRVWREYFLAAEIVGVDIDRDILFQEDRISTYYCDQTDKQSIAAMWDQCQIKEFDLMIDDGLHEFGAGRTLLENSFHKLKSGGIYIIEDVSVGSLIDYKSYLKASRYNYDIVNLFRKGLALGDNSLVVLRK